MTDRLLRRPRPRLRGGRLHHRYSLREIMPPKGPQDPPDPSRDQAMLEFFASENEPPPPESAQH